MNHRHAQTLRGLLFGLLSGSAYLYPDPRVITALHRAAIHPPSIHPSDVHPWGQHPAGAVERSRIRAEVHRLEALYHHS